MKKYVFFIRVSFQLRVIRVNVQDIKNINFFLTTNKKFIIMNTNTNIVTDVERIEDAEAISFAELVAALAMESADCYSEI
jgi:hypothetical protein